MKLSQKKLRLFVLFFLLTAVVGGFFHDPQAMAMNNNPDPSFRGEMPCIGCNILDSNKVQQYSMIMVTKIPASSHTVAPCCMVKSDSVATILQPSTYKKSRILASAVSFVDISSQSLSNFEYSWHGITSKLPPPRGNIFHSVVKKE